MSNDQTPIEPLTRAEKTIWRLYGEERCSIEEIAQALRLREDTVTYAIQRVMTARWPALLGKARAVEVLNG